MALFELEPQFFFPNEDITELPAIDFYEISKSILPQVYQNAENFMAVIRVISNHNQKLYNIIRSLVNCININNAGNGTGYAGPEGYYLKRCAQLFNAPYSTLSTSYQIYTSILNTICFVNSRGRTSDFYLYFAANGLATSFTNENVQENGNATIFFNVPVPDDPLNPPNPTDVFYTSILKLKAAGVAVIVNAANIPYFQLGSLPTDFPPQEVAPGNAGFGVLTPEGVVLNGGYFINN